MLIIGATVRAISPVVRDLERAPQWGKTGEVIGWKCRQDSPNDGLFSVRHTDGSVVYYAEAELMKVLR